MIDLVKDYLKFFLSSFVKQFTKTIIYILIIVIFLFIFSHVASADTTIEYTGSIKVGGLTSSYGNFNTICSDPNTVTVSPSVVDNTGQVAVGTKLVTVFTYRAQQGFINGSIDGNTGFKSTSNGYDMIFNNKKYYERITNTSVDGLVFELQLIWYPVDSIDTLISTEFIGNNATFYTGYQPDLCLSYELVSIKTYLYGDYDSDSDGAIIDNQNKNTQDIINNQNQNAQQASEERKGIWATLTSGISNIGSWFSNLGSTITNGLTILGNFIIDGIKGLLVPTDEQIYEIIEDSQEMSENFGFIGQSMNFFINIFTSFLSMTNGNGCAILPEFTLPFSETNLDIDDVTFWEEQQVCLNSNPILSSNIDTIRTITSIALVCMFLTFAASKFFSILSKNDSGTVATFNSDGTVDVSDYEVVNGFKTVHRKRYK